MSRAWIAVPWRAAHLSADNLPLSRFDVASQNIERRDFSNAISNDNSLLPRFNARNRIAPNIIDRVRNFS